MSFTLFRNVACDPAPPPWQGKLSPDGRQESKLRSTSWKFPLRCALALSLIFIMCGPGNRTDDLFHETKTPGLQQPYCDLESVGGALFAGETDGDIWMDIIKVTSWTSAPSTIHSLALSTSDQNPWRQHEESVAIKS